MVSGCPTRRSRCSKPACCFRAGDTAGPLTSHDALGHTGLKTGFWLEEFAAPYFVFRDAGVELTLASPKGGLPPEDSRSDQPAKQTASMARFKKDPGAQGDLSRTAKLSSVRARDFDSVFYVGGHGPLWDLAESPVSIALIEAFYNSGKPIALVCHSPGALRHVTCSGQPLVKGKRVTGFTNGEEVEVQLSKVVPFLVEDELLRLGAISRREKTGNRSGSPTTASLPGRTRRPRAGPPGHYCSCWRAHGPHKPRPAHLHSSTSNPRLRAPSVRTRLRVPHRDPTAPDPPT